MPSIYGIGGQKTKGDTMTVREYLEQYKKADRRAMRIRKEYEKEMIMIDSISSPLGTDGMPHGSGISKSTENRALKLADKRLKYVEAELDAIEVRQQIFDTVMKLDGIECDVLIEYYVNYYDEHKHKMRTWEDVAEIVHVDPRTVYRIKLRAFKKLSLYVSI